MRCLNGLFLTFLLLVSFAVSAKNAETVILPADVLEVPQESLGTVIGTIGVRPSASSTASKLWGGAFAAAELPVISGSLTFRRVDSTETGSINFARAGNTKALKDGEFKYASFSMKLPEGRYEIIRATAVYPQYTGGLVCVANCRVSSENETAFSVPFEVKRGKVLYLGSFLAHSTTRQAGLGGIPHPDIAYYSYADKWLRDKSIFLKDLSAMYENQVEHALLEVNEHTEYFIIAEDHLPEAKLTREDIAEGRTTHAAKIKAYLSDKKSTP